MPCNKIMARGDKNNNAMFVVLTEKIIGGISVMKKKMFSFLLTLLLVVGLMPNGVLAVETTASGTWGTTGGTWKFNSSTGKLTVSGSGEMPDYGVSWWAGDSPWFHLNKQIKSVVISEGITYIGNGAFGDEFGYGQYEQLTSISLPSTLKGVGVFAFRGAPLKSVNLPDGLQTIKRAAFSDTLLTTVHIPASVSELDENDGGWFAFDCDTLQSITVDPASPYFESQDGVLYSKGKTRIVYFPTANNITSYTIPSTLQSPAYLDDFYYCNSLKSITVAAGATLTLRYADAPGNYELLYMNSTKRPEYSVDIIFQGETPSGVEDWYFFKTIDGTLSSISLNINGGTESTTPQISRLYPANGATNVGCTAANPPIFQVTFDREIGARGDEEYQANVNLTASQPFAIYRAEDNALVYKPTQYSGSDFLIAYTSDKSTLSVTPINRHILLDPGTEYYITMGAGFVTFADGTKSPAITKGQWSFTTEGEKEEPEEEKLTFSIARTSVSLLPGQTANPRVTLTPSDAKVSWTSSRSSVARVSSDGTITGVAPGTATITGTATLGNQKKTVTCTVTVNQNLLFGWTKTAANLEVGDLESLSFTYQPADARISVTSSNPSVIKVEGSQYSKGSGYTTIRAMGGGTATITAKVTADDQEKVGTILLTVGNNQIPEDLFLKQNDNKKCTLISSAMMLRNKARLNGDSGWRNITEAALTKIAWGPNGMIWDVTIRGIKETTQGLASNGYNTLEKKKNYFISLLENHPEGIVIYDHGKPHAVFLTDYDVSTDTFYCADPAPSASNGRIPLIDSTLPGDNQNEIINGIDQIGYVSHSTVLKTLSSTQISTHCPVDMVIRVHGQSLDSRLINGTRSNEYATMSTVGTGDEKQVTVTVNGDTITDEDIEVEIIGTGTGEMTFTVKHNFTDNTSESYIFADLPVSASTVCKVNDITPQSTILLTIKDGDTNEETYVAKNAEIQTFPFTDVKSTDWFYSAVQYVFDNGIMNGTSATTFAPNGTVERSQVVQMLYNLEGQPTVTGNSGFSDIKSDDWYSKAVAWAERNGVVDGYENNAFRPGKAVSREEFAQMLYNYSKYKRYDLSAAADLSEFPDGSSVSNWANSAVAWANGNGLINGHDDGRLDPSGTAIRAQAASILMGFDRKYVTE